MGNLYFCTDESNLLMIIMDEIIHFQRESSQSLPRQFLLVDVKVGFVKVAVTVGCVRSLNPSDHWCGADWKDGLVS